MELGWEWSLFQRQQKREVFLTIYIVWIMAAGGYWRLLEAILGFWKLLEAI
jgi:hypothetical protein